MIILLFALTLYVMNNPFDYQPSDAMLKAKDRLIAHIQTLCDENEMFASDVSKGKMFGVLIVEAHKPLFAFSGQIGGRFEWPGFVPAVFDYLDEDGYFKTHEREISKMNRLIADMESSTELKSAREEYKILEADSRRDIEHYRLLTKAAKVERDLIRGKGLVDEQSLIRESQFMKAEMHRKKVAWRETLDKAGAKVAEIEGQIRSLKMQRQKQSDSLQQWLFEQFVFSTQQGESKSLLQIFDAYYRLNDSFLAVAGTAVPPSGAGECCEPKLLYYAFRHALKPIEMGMFWWGESPRQEIRHHGQFYPACSGKCKPILEFMLPELSSSSASADDDSVAQELIILYEDEALIVVNKPAGMLSVPGRSERQSVFSLLANTHPDARELAMVHRLDMDTSGLLVVAKTKRAHAFLQRQFAEHTIHKEYIALLSHPLTDEEGIISLPLAADHADRPRQKVDFETGKAATTVYKSLRDAKPNAVRLMPQTGRTHQLRVHCAHRQGLDNPIKGDRLYGNKAERLYLHAEVLEFTHPLTGERMTFRYSADW